MKYKDNFKQNYVIERFKKGEISIVEAFNALTSQTDITDVKFQKNKFVSPYYLKGKFLDVRNYSYNTKANNFLDIKKSIGTDYLTQENHTENISEINNEDKMNELIKEMDSLIGLDSIKETIREYMAYIKVQNLRKKYNLKTSPVVMHMIFKGNPGTGKTTIARIIARIFKEIGFLNEGEIIEAERADLVGEYIGHTAQKTRKVIQKAIGGVLFIDEAYSLARGGEKDFGKESIDTMVKAMEDYKDNLIIILAGYRKEMDFFLKTNPGLASRFAIQLDFPDYTIDELVKIAELMYADKEYILDKTSKHYIYRSLSNLRNKEIINGNARTVRNLVERSIRHHARRIIKSNNINRNSLIYIIKEDLYEGGTEND